MVTFGRVPIFKSPCLPQFSYHRNPENVSATKICKNSTKNVIIRVGTGGRVFADKICPQGRAFDFDQFFKCPGFARRDLAAGIDSHIIENQCFPS